MSVTSTSVPYLGLSRNFCYFYRPQRSCGQGNIFTPVCHSVNGGGVCLSACWDTTPQSRHPLGPDTPPVHRGGLPQCMLGYPPKQTPPREADSSIRSTSGRYASYWNAFFYLESIINVIATLLKGCIDFISIFRNTFEHTFHGKHSQGTIAFITVISGVNNLF